jgi:hypothetical protein
MMLVSEVAGQSDAGTYCSDTSRVRFDAGDASFLCLANYFWSDRLMQIE